MIGFSEGLSKLAQQARIVLARSSVAVIGLGFGVAADADNAPFGFEWGQTLGRVEAITGTPARPDLLWNRVHAIHSETAPSLPPETDFISLSVDPELGLGRIIWFSDDIVNDAFGFAGKEKYFKHKARLSEQYGPPLSSGEIFARDIWNEADEFYQCLAHSTCGMYFAVWGTDDGLVVSLQLKALRRGQGYIEITYEGPNWGDILDEVGKTAAGLDERSF